MSASSMSTSASIELTSASRKWMSVSTKSIIFDKLEERFDALQRSLFQSSVLVIVALIGLIATQI